METTNTPSPTNRLSILEIERFAVHDGPGIRTVVFFQGCPLHCPWCSNPESQPRKPQLLHVRAQCVGCGRCEAACPEGNITFSRLSPAGDNTAFDNPAFDRAAADSQTSNRPTTHQPPSNQPPSNQPPADQPAADSPTGNTQTFHYPLFNRPACTACQACRAACPTGAIRFAGQTLSTDEIMRTLLRDKAYYQNSGGGVTFSGGEAFMQSDGLTELLARCKNEGLHTAVETCGQADQGKIRKAYPLTDLFLFDLKHTDKALFRQETGADLDTILANLRYIAGRNPAKVTLRIPVIPGFNFHEKTLGDLFALAAGLHIPHVHLLPYHTLGKDKYAQLGLPYPYPYETMLAPRDLLPFQAAGRRMGLDVRIGG